MDNSTNIELIRAEALGKIGGNVLNFSKLENSLKLLLSVSHVEGITPVYNSIKARQRSLRKQSLGTLVTAFNKDVIRDEAEAALPQMTTKPRLSLSFSVASTHSEEWKQMLRTLVQERNRLIHHDLAYVDITSTKDYRNLIAVLDEQNPRLIAQLEDLRWMLCSISETIQIFRHSPEFRQLMNTLDKSDGSIYHR